MQFDTNLNNIYESAMNIFRFFRSYHKLQLDENIFENEEENVCFQLPSSSPARGKVSNVSRLSPTKRSHANHHGKEELDYTPSEDGDLIDFSGDTSLGDEESHPADWYQAVDELQTQADHQIKMKEIRKLSKQARGSSANNLLSIFSKSYGSGIRIAIFF